MSARSCGWLTLIVVCFDASGSGGLNKWSINYVRLTRVRRVFSRFSYILLSSKLNLSVLAIKSRLCERNNSTILCDI